MTQGQEPLVDAYLVVVDGMPIGVYEMPASRYWFSYGATLNSFWLRLLPARWKSWMVYDLVRQKPVCGAVKGQEEDL